LNGQNRTDAEDDERKRLGVERGDGRVQGVTISWVRTSKGLAIAYRGVFNTIGQPKSWGRRGNSLNRGGKKRSRILHYVESQVEGVQGTCRRLGKYSPDEVFSWPGLIPLAEIDAGPPLGARGGKSYARMCLANVRALRAYRGEIWQTCA